MRIQKMSKLQFLTVACPVLAIFISLEFNFFANTSQHVLRKFENTLCIAHNLDLDTKQFSDGIMLEIINNHCNRKRNFILFCFTAIFHYQTILFHGQF